MLYKPEVYAAIPGFYLMALAAWLFDSQITAMFRTVFGESLFRMGGYHLKFGKNRHLIISLTAIGFAGIATVLVVMLALGY